MKVPTTASQMLNELTRSMFDARPATFLDRQGVAPEDFQFTPQTITVQVPFYSEPVQEVTRTNGFRTTYYTYGPFNTSAGTATTDEPLNGGVYDPVVASRYTPGRVVEGTGPVPQSDDQAGGTAGWVTVGADGSGLCPVNAHCDTCDAYRHEQGDPRYRDWVPTTPEPGRETE